MTNEDHSRYLELAYLEPDGRLTAAERSGLAHHLAGCAECREARAGAAGLDRLLAGSRVRVEHGFSARVLESLPPAGWEARSPRSWTAALALLALLGVAAAVAARLGSAEPAPPLAGAFFAVLELFRSAGLAGAGLVGASWRGVGIALGEALAAAPLGFVVFGVLVAALDVLFVRFLLRAMRAARAGGAERRPGRGERGSAR